MLTRGADVLLQTLFVDGNSDAKSAKKYQLLHVYVSSVHSVVFVFGRILDKEFMLMFSFLILFSLYYFAPFF